MIAIVNLRSCGGLRRIIADHEEMITSLQHETSWAMEGAMKRAYPHEASIDWAEGVRRTLAEADGVGKARDRRGVFCDTEPNPGSSTPLRASAPPYAPPPPPAVGGDRGSLKLRPKSVTVPGVPEHRAAPKLEKRVGPQPRGGLGSAAS